LVAPLAERALLDHKNEAMDTAQTDMATIGSGLDVPGALFIGDINTTEVVIGKQRAISVDNATVPPTVTIPSLAIGAVLTVASLAVVGLSALATLLVTGASTFMGSLSAAGGVLSDVYANRTPGHAVTLETTGGDMNVLLSPNGNGSVVVSAGTALTADVLRSTSAATNLTLAPTGAFVAIAAGKQLSVNSVGPTTGPGFSIFSATGGNISISPGTGGSVVLPSATATDNTTTRLLALNGSNALVYQNTNSGQFASAWTPLANFAAGTSVVINYVRVGNAVSGAAIFSMVDPTGSPASASFTLPVARAGNFVNVAGFTGLVFFQDGRAATYLMAPDITSTNSVDLTILTATFGAGTLYATFAYTLVG
jgi:hypothetical protein